MEDFTTSTKHIPTFGKENPRDRNEEGRKIFINNVSEAMQYETFQELVEQHGTVEDFFNPGRGFAFLTFSTADEAYACINAMDNTTVAGKLVQMNIAKPKAEKPRGCKLFVHGVSQETTTGDLQEVFEEFGTVTDAFNPGRGFAFITFSKAADATAAMEALEGQEVCGSVVNVSVAKPKGSWGPPPRDMAPRESAPRGGRGFGRDAPGGRRQEASGNKLFVHNVDEHTSQEDLIDAFEVYGTVTDAFNSRRGFAFVTFETDGEAMDAMEALEGQEVCGRVIRLNVAEPRGSGGRGGRGGRRGGRGFW